MQSSSNLSQKTINQFTLKCLTCH